MCFEDISITVIPTEDAELMKLYKGDEYEEVLSDEELQFSSSNRSEEEEKIKLHVNITFTTLWLIERK
ncbi:hypothetical protein L1887_15162 [Cichorium endivia]|nr:hypothetical protein L1887_15162 [Cichorium endivia]